MIHLEAVYHRASQQFCYALNEEILMVGLQTGEEAVSYTHLPEESFISQVGWDMK